VTRCKRIEIMLEGAADASRGDASGRHGGCEGFGLVLRGGTHRGDSEQRSRPITVSRVVPNTPADRSAAIKPNSITLGSSELVRS